jgi:DMSO/TMAO reductase YedYZ molybdopterin-dependent catalytic subunit
MSEPENGAGGTGSEATKLTRTKQRWAAEGRFLTGRIARPEVERLPPGQHRVNDWPVLDLGEQPRVAREVWRLSVDGRVAHRLVLDWAGFVALPHVDQQSDIHCVTTWSRYDNRWRGVATRDLMALVEPDPEARFVELQSYDGYTTNLPIDDFAAPDALLAEAWDGAPLTREHGGPVRAVVPHLYFWKSAKWLKGITFLAEDRSGFWEQRGYHDRGDPWTEQRYSD